MLQRLAALDPARYPLLLDSAAGGPLAAATVLLAAPRAALWLGADGRLGADGTAIEGEGFLGALERWWLRERATSAWDSKHAAVHSTQSKDSQSG